MLYAPVCRSARSLARLACVRPAANVRSEPESNSQINESTRPDYLLFTLYVCKIPNPSKFEVIDYLTICEQPF